MTKKIPARARDLAKALNEKEQTKSSPVRNLFRKFSHKTSEAVGSPTAFILAVTTVLIWIFTGPVFHYSDTWQLVINTATTIVTFLMVFLIQNSQNRDSKAVHLKLDELIRGVTGARTEMVDLEDLTDEELETMHREFHALHEKLADTVSKRKTKSKTR